MRIDTVTDIWMLSPKVLRGLTRGVLRELHNRMIDDRYDLGEAFDLKQFEGACNTINRSCQVLNQHME